MPSSRRRDWPGELDPRPVAGVHPNRPTPPAGWRPARVSERRTHVRQQPLHRRLRYSGHASAPSPPRTLTGQPSRPASHVRPWTLSLAGLSATRPTDNETVLGRIARSPRNRRRRSPNDALSARVRLSARTGRPIRRRKTQTRAAGGGAARTPLVAGSQGRSAGGRGYTSRCTRRSRSQAASGCATPDRRSTRLSVLAPFSHVCAGRP